jgi:hypothetical protein
MLSPNNYGITHAAITIAIMIPFALFGYLPLLAAAGAVSCAWWIHRELQGQGDLMGYPKDYKTIYSDWDRRMDWISPIIAAVVVFGITYFLT